MIIIFDTNIWISELGLNSMKGSATRFFIKQKKAKIALPEVIRLEIISNVKEGLTNYISNIETSYRQLLTIFGKLKEIALPNEDEIMEKAENLVLDTGLEVIEIPFSLESSKKSLLKIIEKLPPSDKSQQFKDGVIWADCVNLLKQDEVCLVTGDKAFYQNREYKNGLSENLKAEISDLPHRLKIFPNLSDLLKEIKSPFQIDQNSLAEKYFATNSKSIEGIALRHDYIIQMPPKVSVTSFITEDPNKVIIEFEIIYECIDSSNKGRSNAILKALGDGFYFTDTEEFQYLKSLGEELYFKDELGEDKVMKNVVIRAGNIVIGHKEVNYNIKFKIDN
jgi:hypothetical protein